MGNAGNAVAAPQEQVRISPQAASQVGDALTRAGAVGMQVAGQAMDEQRRKQEKADEELRRIQSVRAVATTKNGLYTLEDSISRGVLDGSISRADAGKMWDEQSAKIVQDSTADLDPRYQESVRAGLLDTQFSLSSRVRDSVTERTQQEFAGELLATREAMQRDAVNDRASANANWVQILDSQGPLAGMTPQQIAADKQRFREGTAETEAYSIVNGAKHSMQALGEAEKRINGDAFADLDPQRRAVLNNTIAGARASLEQKAVIAAQRAEIAQQRRERQAASAFDAISKLSLEGKLISSEYAAQVARQTAGTPYADALPALLHEAQQGTAFAMQPLDVQRAMRDATAAQGNKDGWTPALVKRFDRMDAGVKAAEREYADDPLRAALDRGVIAELAPLDMSSIDGITKSVADRLTQARQVETRVTGAVSPFTADEARQIGTVINAMPVKQRADAIATISGAVGARAATALAGQISKNDRALGLAFGYGTTRTTSDRYHAELVLDGQQLIADGRVKIDTAKESGIKAQIAQRIAGTYSDQNTENAVKDAAYLMYASLANGRAPGFTAGSDLDTAINLATGGIVERKGGKIPLPPGWKEQQFDQALRVYPAASIAGQTVDGKVYVNGVAVTAEEFVRRLPDATLRAAGGRGKYAITAGSGVVTNGQGRPIIIDLLGVANAR